MYISVENEYSICKGIIFAMYANNNNTILRKTHSKLELIKVVIKAPTINVNLIWF